MTSSIVGRNGLPDGLGTDREPQVVATRTTTAATTPPAATPASAIATAAPSSTSIATPAATQTSNAISKSPTNNDDKRDLEVADPDPDPAPAPAQVPAPSPAATSNLNSNLDSNKDSNVPAAPSPLTTAANASSSAPISTSASAPASTTIDESASAPAQKSSPKQSPEVTLNRPSTPNPDLASASTKVSSQPTPSTPPHVTPNGPSVNVDPATSTTAQQRAEVSSDAEVSAPMNVDSDNQMSVDTCAQNVAVATSNVDQAQQSTPLQLQLQSDGMRERFAPSTPYAPTAMPTINEHAYMMMALATMSGAPTAMSPPPTVTPAQVTLPNPSAEPLGGLTTANSIRQADTEKALESFARVEFADSVFQMTTYAVIIGRDQRALEQARRDERRAEDHRRRVEENANLGLPPPSPIKPDHSKFSKSYVSEEGGMLGPESDTGGNPRPTKRRKTSTQGSSQHDNDEAAVQAQENMISNRQYVSHTPGAAAVDLASLRPSPYHVPFIGIHSPGPKIASKTKAISREHLKIAYNQDAGVFEAIPLHKNGFFCEDVHHKSGKVVLRCGDRLQIKDINFRFLINGVERGRTGAEEYEKEEQTTAYKRRHAQGGKEMSFDFESAHGNGEVQDTSDELSDVASPPESPDFDDDDEVEVEEQRATETVEAEPEAEAEAEAEAELEADADADADIDADADADAEMDMDMDMDMDLDMDVDMDMSMLESDSLMKQEGMLDSHQDHLMGHIPKKRGPGRPPKNGVMSKREQRLLKKQQQEMAKKTLPQAPPVEPPIKRKVGRPRKHPLPEGSVERPEKRKYKPRKPREDGAEGSDAERRAREKKEKKARPKSPPLELKIEDYTEEQLQKPNKNYGVLIDETLTAAGPDGLTLKQIYKRICQRYPWFHFHTETKGWESSVRHNLIGNEAFRKDETTNLWSRVPGVELDAGKKRKASSPGVTAQAYGQYPYPYNAQHMAPGAPGYPPGQAPPGYQMPTYTAQQNQPGRPAQPYGTSASPPAPAPGQPIPTAVASQPPVPAQLPPGYGPPPAPARPQLGVPQPGTYSSPYAPRPLPPVNTQIKSEEGHANTAAAPATVPLIPQQQQQHLPPPPPPSVATKTVPGASPAPAQQQSATPVNRTPSLPAIAVPARPTIEPRLLAAVVNLKNGLVENLKKARNPKAEGIVMSALNRCLGLKKEATENDKMEAICMKGLRQVIESFQKSKSPTPGPASHSAAEPPFCLDSKVLASLNGFKDVSVKALNPKLGEAKAEAVTLSAIDRVLGLADASIVPPPGEGEAVGHFEGIEQHLMKSIRQLVAGVSQNA
ncbi:hypothetical protein ACHAPU_010027 [Fusarium lateritium]